MASIASSLVGAAASLRSLAASHPALVASGELLAALGDVTFAVTAMSAVAPPTAALPPQPAPAPPALTLEDVAPYIAQAGHRELADGALARLNRYLRSEERIWRAISRLPLGLHGRTRLMHAAHVGDVVRLRFLIEHGAAVCAVDRFGRSALDYAVAGGHVACAAVLRGAGAVDGVAFGGALVETWGPVMDAGGWGGVDGVWSLAACGGGRIAVGHASGAIVLRDAATGVVTATLQGHMGAVNALAQLLSGRLISGSSDFTVRVWDVDTGVCEAVLAGHTDGVYALAELLDGRLASGGWDENVRLWDVSTRACTTAVTHASGVHALAALPQGGFAAGCEDGSIALWSAAGTLTATLGGAGFGRVLSLALLSDGRLVSGHCQPYMIRVWDLEHYAVDVVIRGHKRVVRSLAALPDGRLLSCSDDLVLKLWDERVLSVRGGAAADTCAATLIGHGGGVNALAVLPNRHVVSGGDDGMVRLLK